MPSDPYDEMMAVLKQIRRIVSLKNDPQFSSSAEMLSARLGKAIAEFAETKKKVESDIAESLGIPVEALGEKTAWMHEEIKDAEKR